MLGLYVNPLVLMLYVNLQVPPGGPPPWCSCFGYHFSIFILILCKTVVIRNAGWHCTVDYCYSRNPLLRPPSESHWCGRKTGVVVKEGLDYFITCALRNTCICIRQCITVSSTLKMAFGVFRPLESVSCRPQS